jgi:molecular chaperone DnaJ
MKRCYYEILNVERTADDATIKKAYRKLALKYHPDRNPDNPEAEAAFKECAEAYEVLRDPEKRRLYDSYGHEGLKSQGFEGFGGMGDIFSTFSDIFEGFFGGFGGSGRPGGPQHGRDLRYDLEISLEDAALGSDHVLDIGKEVPCEACSGMGQKDGQTPPVCSTCGGQGQVLRSQGFFRMATTCPDCRGMGRKVTDPCPECQGQGHKYEEKELSVHIPPGIDHGQRLRMRAEGEAGLLGGEPGDLYVMIHVRPHPKFERQGSDLFCSLEVSMAQAALGRTVTVDTLIDGEDKLKLPQGVQTGEVLRLRGLGMPQLRQSRRGDLNVQIVVRTPKKLSKKQRELLEEVAALGDEFAAPEPEGENNSPKKSLENKKKRLWGFN